MLTSHYADALPSEEMLDGVRVVRVPVALPVQQRRRHARLRPASAWREIRRHDVVSIHLPQVEAALATLLARLAGRKPILTYHCDLQMPPVWYGRIIDKLTFWDNLIAGKLADTIVAYTEDFARHSPFLSRFWAIAECGMRNGDRRARCNESRIPNPASDTAKCASSSRRSSFPTRLRMAWRRCEARAELNGKQRVIGFAARFAYEKGAGYLINAIPHILDEFPDIRVLFAGPYKDVIGETIWDEMQPLVKQYEHVPDLPGHAEPGADGRFLPRLRRGHGGLDQQHRVVRAGAGGGVHVRHAGGGDRSAGRARSR